MKLRGLLLAAMLCTLCIGQASALEYTMDAPDDYLFARPTSDDTVYEWEDPNVDRSKNTALIPPTFGSATSYLPGSGTPLTPNLVPGALDGGLVSQVGSVTYPAVDTGSGWTGTASTGWTDVTSDLYYSGGYLGTLRIPAIGLSVKVYEGTDSATLARARATSRTQAFGTATAVLLAITGASGMTLETCTPWNPAIPSPGPPSWGQGRMKSPASRR